MAKSVAGAPLMRMVATFFVLSLTLAPAPPPSVKACVTKVVDGDTIVLADGTVVRYIGVDAPERQVYGHKKEMLSEEATMFNARLVAGRSVLLQFDARLRDAYNRLLAYVFVEGRLVNAELVRWGYARADPYPPNYRYQRMLKAMEDIARKHNRGLWARENLISR